MTTIRRSLAYSAADSYLSLALQLLSTIVISRILTPAEAGTFAVAAVFTGLASSFRNFGVTEFLIQERELRNETIQSAMMMNIIVSWAVGLLLFFGAPYIADFFRSEGISKIIRVQSMSFVIIPFGAITMAYFRRNLNLQPVFFASAAANTVAFLTSVTLALNGFGYMSLAWSAFAGVATTVAVSMWFRPANLPKYPSFKGIGRAFHFGKYASGIYLFGQMGNGAPEMIVGKARDVISVAFFSRANGLVELFNRLVLNAVWPVCLPYFSKSARENKPLSVAFLTGASYLTAVSWPILAFLGIGSFALIRIIYGPQWTPSAPLAKILCSAAAVDVVYHLTKESLMAKGLVKESNKLQFLSQLSRVAGLLLVVPFGLEGACWGILAATVLNGILSHRLLARTIQLKAADLLRACRPSMILTGSTALPIFVYSRAYPIDEGNFVAFTAVGMVVAAASWLVCLRCLNHPLWTEGSLMVRKFLPSK